MTLLRHLIDSIEKHGNALWLLGIEHQRIDKHCPWQNGRIERFFGTLKQNLNHFPIHHLEHFNQELKTFQYGYNTVRTHNNLNGRTPNEVWYETDIDNRKSTEVYYFNAWDDLLTGFYHPP